MVTFVSCAGRRRGCTSVHKRQAAYQAAGQRRGGQSSQRERSRWRAPPAALTAGLQDIAAKFKIDASLLLELSHLLGVSREHFADRLAQVCPFRFRFPFPLSRSLTMRACAEESTRVRGTPGGQGRRGGHQHLVRFLPQLVRTERPPCLSCRVSALTPAAPGSAAGAMCTTAATMALGSRCRRLARQRR